MSRTGFRHSMWGTRQPGFSKTQPTPLHSQSARLKCLSEAGACTGISRGNITDWNTARARGRPWHGCFQARNLHCPLPVAEQNRTQLKHYTALAIFRHSCSLASVTDLKCKLEETTPKTSNPEKYLVKQNHAQSKTDPWVKYNPHLTGNKNNQTHKEIFGNKTSFLL